MARAIHIEDKARLAEGAPVGVVHARRAVLVALVALPGVRVVDLGVSFARFEAVCVRRVETHVVVTAGATVDSAGAVLALRRAWEAELTGCDG